MSKVKQGQSFIDKVIQQTGSVENALEMAIANGVSITDDPSIGALFVPAGTIKKNMVAFFAANEEPASDITLQLKDEVIEVVGLGAMAIENSFIVS